MTSSSYTSQAIRVHKMSRARSKLSPGRRAPMAWRWPTAITVGDLDVIDTLVSPDFVDHGAPPGTVPPGPAGYKMTMRLLHEAMQ
jgi:hypothetical protein